MTEYADLGRRFYRAPDEKHPEESAQTSYLLASLALDKSLGWSELQQCRLVVILGEPGSGKSTELRIQADRLCTQSKRAFFVRLDRLVEESWDSIIDERGHESLQAWKRGDDNAWFFFDSVDESKLRKPDDFLTALERIAVALSARALRRARLVFSSRISEWRPVTDLAALRRHFPPPPRPGKTTGSDKHSGWYRRSGFEATGHTAKRETTDTSADEGPTVFHLVPLDPERVRRYAQWRGLTNPEAFVHALETHHAWEFARRPLDVNALIEYWQQYARLGSLTELIEHGLEVALRETEARETSYVLTPESGRKGAEALAAAALLCRKVSFKVPDDAHIPTSAALDAAACLPATWSPAQRRALLSRPLFDGATYGCIRFHHRRVLEYLGASWLRERIRSGCPLDRLIDLLFADHQGQHILRPALAPVAAWLANGSDPHNGIVREWLLRTDPTIHFSYGDPAQLPTEYKRQVLHALADRYKDRQLVWLEYESPVLARFADPALAGEVSALILDRGVSASLRADMLLLARYGRLTACLDAALSVVADPNEEDEVKQYAIAAIGDCGDTSIRVRLSACTRERVAFSSHSTGALCRALYPDIIDADGLADLLQKSEQPLRHGVDLPLVLRDHLQHTLNPTRAAPLLEAFLGLLATAPHLSRVGRDTESISQRFEWVCGLLPIVLEKLLEKSGLTNEELQLATRGIRMLDTQWGYRVDARQEEVRSLSAAVRRHTELVREYFWQGVERFRAANQRDPDWWGQVTGLSHLVVVTHSDFSWMIVDACERESGADCALALRVAVDVWRPFGLQRGSWCGLLRVPRAKPDLRGMWWRCVWQRLTRPARIRWAQQVRGKLLDRYWWERRRHSLKRAYSWMRDQYVLHRHLRSLYSGKAKAWLFDLSREADTQHNLSQWAATDWSGLRARRGPLIAWAAQRGCEVSWVDHTPLLAHEKPEVNRTSIDTIIGLCGLQSLWLRGKMDFAALSEDDAPRAARYAFSELNGLPEWFPELALAQPQAVRDVVKVGLEGEWLIPPDREHALEVLSKLLWHGEGVRSLIIGDLLVQIQLEDPRHSEVLDAALSILLGTSEPPRAELARLAKERAVEYPADSPFLLAWLALWLELDALGALEFLALFLDALDPPQAEDVMLRLCDRLRGDRFGRGPRVAEPDYLRPQAMRIWVPLVYHRIRPEDDIDRARGGAYTPTTRDDAQDFRSGLLQRLAQLAHPEVPTVLNELRDIPELARHRDWLTHLLDEHLRRQVDLHPWRAEDIRAFAEEYETDPHDDTDLFRIACSRLTDIKREVERAENSLREEVHRDWDEPQLRRWFQRKLSDRSRGRYSIPQEAEIDQRQRPDLRFENPRIPTAVPVEIKWADNWTAMQLLERLENQLVGQYLHADKVRYGVYLLGYIGRKQRWDYPRESRQTTLVELLDLIGKRAAELANDLPGVAGIRVISIDFTT